MSRQTKQHFIVSVQFPQSSMMGETNGMFGFQIVIGKQIQQAELISRNSKTLHENLKCI